jgi:hypothetical protein
MNNSSLKVHQPSRWFGFVLFLAVSALYFVGWWVALGFFHVLDRADIFFILRVIIIGWVFLVAALYFWLRVVKRQRSLAQGVMVSLCVVLPVLLLGLYALFNAIGAGVGHGCCG